MENYTTGKQQQTSHPDPLETYERMIRMEESAQQFAKVYYHCDLSNPNANHDFNGKATDLSKQQPPSPPGLRNRQPSGFKLALLEVYYYGATTRKPSHSA